MSRMFQLLRDSHGRGRGRDNQEGRIDRSLARSLAAEYDFTRVRLRAPLILARSPAVSATPTANYLAV